MVDGRLTNKRLIELVREKREGWRVIGLIKRSMIFCYLGMWGKVEEIVDRPKVVCEGIWKVLCVPFERKNKKVYCLAFTETKLTSGRERSR
ncbi:MAG: hypothetical protein N3B10_15345 [Armatimonadetes bacterium]|nr:hypothetical protein [Armatimonadota bacterium]